MDTSQTLSRYLWTVIKIDENGAHLAPDPQQAAQILGAMAIGEKTIVVGAPMDPSAARVALTLMYLGKITVIDARITPEHFGSHIHTRFLSIH